MTDYREAPRGPERALGPRNKPEAEFSSHPWLWSVIPHRHRSVRVISRFEIDQRVLTLKYATQCILCWKETTTHV